MKREHIENAFKDIKFRLVSENLKAVAESLKDKSRSSRDFIEVKTLVRVFEKMAKDRSDKQKTK